MDAGSTSPEVRCSNCGASVRERDEWCSQCFEPRETEPEPPKFAGPDAFLGPPIPSGYTRWAKSDVSFGPFGRLLLTLFLCVLPVLWFLYFFFPIGIIWLVGFCPVVLSSIWKKVPIRD